MVGAEMGGVHRNAPTFQFLIQPLGHRVVIVQTIKAPGDPGLVRDHDQGEACFRHTAWVSALGQILKCEISKPFTTFE